MTEKAIQLRAKIVRLDRERCKLAAELYDLRAECKHPNLVVPKGYVGTCPDCGEEECEGRDETIQLARVDIK